MSYTQALGKVSIVGKGTWSNALAYDKLDVVKHDGGSYIALQNVPAGTLITDTAYWMSIVDKGEKGDTGSTGATGNGVASIAKTGTSGLVDTYTVTYTNGQTITYTVTNGAEGADGVGIVSVEKTATSGNVDTYTILFTNGETTTFRVTNGSVTSVDGLTGDVVLDHKANIDGYYVGLTSGATEQVLSNVKETDKMPFVFRTSGGSLNIGDRKEMQIVGASVVWNQLVQNGNFTSADNWQPSNGTRTVSNGEMTVTINSGSNYALAYQSLTVISGHKVLMMCDAKVGTATKAQLQFYADSSTMVETESSSYKRIAIIGIAGSSYTRMRLRLTGSGGLTAIYRNAVAYDLTAMFGSAIADRAYALEQANAGSGVAWLISFGFFTKPYYPYKAAGIESVKTSAHETIAFNQWDEIWESGGIDNTGNNTNDNTRIRTKNYIPIFPNTDYYITSPINIGGRWYDANKNVISTFSGRGARTSPANAYYLRFYLSNTTEYGNDVCISIRWDGERDGEYEAYQKYSYPIDSNVTLNGILQLDANNNIYADGDTYEADGTVTRNYEKRAYQSGDEELANAITDGTYTVVKLATPTTESADPFQSPMIVDDWGTERFIDTAYEAGNRDFEMPVGHTTQYPINIRAKTEVMPDSPNGDGDYIVRQTNGKNEYVLLEIPNELPTAPTTDGTYTLKVTVTGGNAVYSWGNDT